MSDPDSSVLYVRIPDAVHMNLRLLAVRTRVRVTDLVREFVTDGLANRGVNVADQPR